jgi:putative DNA primase/helicase
MNRGAGVQVVHPELSAAWQAIARAADKLLAIESQALRLAPLIDRGDIPHADATAVLLDVATTRGLCAAHGRETVKHVIREGLAGRSAGVGFVPPKAANNPVGTVRPERRVPLEPLNLADFLKLELPPRRLMLEPWLTEKGTAMIYSPRGFGKTLLSLSVGFAVATGTTLLGWSASEPHRVLYADGEMPGAEMQRRLAAIVAGFHGELAPDYFHMLSADLTERGLPDLAMPDGQAAFDDAIGNAELIILDNISTLCRSGKENEAESWQGVQDWMLSHRRAGRSILFDHHAGKGGNQRGTSKREDVLDSVIALRRPHDYHPDQGARFEIHFEKHRGFYGSDAEPFEARYEERDDAAIWTRTAIADVDMRRVVDALRDGMSIREAAAELGMSKSKVERLKTKAREQGMLGD